MKSINSKRVIKLIYFLAPFVSIMMFLAFWQYSSLTNPGIIPTPAAAVKRFIEIQNRPINKLDTFGHTWVSLKRVLIAVSFCSITGVAFGLMLGWNKWFRSFCNPLFQLFRAIPPIAWIPLITIWFGIGEFPKVLVIIIAAFVAIAINTYTGVKMLDPFLVDVARSFGVKRNSMLYEIVFPASLPAIFAGLKTSIGTGWMVILAAELIISKSGLGFLISIGMQNYDIPLVLVGMIMIGTVGASLSGVLSILERKICVWVNQE